MDPTMGRSSVTRETYFANTPMDRIIVTRGRNPSPLRGSNYFSFLYWPGPGSTVTIEEFAWIIEAIDSFTSIHPGFRNILNCRVRILVNKNPPEEVIPRWALKGSG